MVDQTTKTQNFLEKALGNLEAARLCLASNFLEASVNRAYFAAYQAAVAALLKSGESSGTFGHKWVQAKFNEKLIKRKKWFPRRFAPYLIEMQGLRNAADYGHGTIGQRKAAEQLRRSDEIVTEIRKEFMKQ